eukprot:scaffold11959_cov126-Isochrysis_galbana.AAC.6
MDASSMPGGPVAYTASTSTCESTRAEGWVGAEEAAESRPLDEHAFWWQSPATGDSIPGGHGDHAGPLPLAWSKTGSDLARGGVQSHLGRRREQ